MPSGVRIINRQFNQEIQRHELAQRNRLEASALVLYGRVTCQLEALSSAEGIPIQLLTARLSELLQTGGSGAEHRVSDMPIQTLEPTQRVPKVESAGGTRGKASKHKTVRRGQKPKKVAKWTPAMRKVAARRMRAMWREGKFAKAA